MTEPAFRVGIGYDIHRLVPGRRLVLGGVHVPADVGLLGHSDADALCHAVADALLGALALGDIGRHFPDTDPRFMDADSTEILACVVEMIRDRGFVPHQMDANIIAEKPRLAPYIESMREALAARLGVPVDRVSVKARTAEGLGPVGAGEAVAVQTVVLVAPIG
jgi:2-C-methyl-D-erythritol 2,4-cyclodiphosphate synthase